LNTKNNDHQKEGDMVINL